MGAEFPNISDAEDRNPVDIGDRSPVDIGDRSPVDIGDSSTRYAASNSVIPEDPISMVRSRLDETLFVEAGAGTGKTYALVERVLALIGSGRALITEIAAITFTEAAAAELQGRIRSKLAEAATSIRQSVPQAASPPNPFVAAQEHLGEASISTLHSFARSILADHPIEVGIPPVFEVLDEASSKLALQDEWSTFVGDFYGLCGSDPDRSALVSRSLSLGIRIENMLDLAELLRKNWDRIDTSTCALTEITSDQAVIANASQFVQSFEQVIAMSSKCVDASDNMAIHLSGLREERDAIESAIQACDLDNILSTLASPLIHKKLGKLGNKKNWRDESLAKVRSTCEQVAVKIKSMLEALGKECVGNLVAEIVKFTVSSVDGRKSAGVLDFHDLLVLALKLVETNHKVGDSLRNRWKFLLIDEFQDTDPLQFELALLLATEGENVRPGKLFFVGDPKQSIYRFRRADISAYEKIKDRIANQPVALSTNRRSVPAILEWVNEICGEIFAAGVPGKQPPYVELIADGAEDESHVPGISLLGGPGDPEAKISEVRESEAREIVEGCRRAVEDGWKVRDSGATPAAWREAAYSDIAVLVPDRNSVSELVRAMENEGVPHRLESSSLAMGSQEVRDLLNICRVIDNPADQVAVVAALRSAVFSCSDSDLLEFRRAGGQWNPLLDLPSGLSSDQPVYVAMGTLKGLCGSLWSEGASGVVGRVIRVGKMFELAVYQDGLHRDRWKRLRYIHEKARDFVGSGGSLGTRNLQSSTSLRGFIRWLEIQMSERITLTDQSLVDSGSGDSSGQVRILTVHASKGLEFPIVFMSGFNARMNKTQSDRFLFAPGGHIEYKVKLYAGSMADRG
ncbi:MAG TPA: UvrD-helicase domain-containing protein, partial [Acidimicrobiales bacterium]|nr:UvrD-helicase domain-containing protein [Acidimicrobiales bacterium]